MDLHQGLCGSAVGLKMNRVWVAEHHIAAVKTKGEQIGEGRE